MLFVRFLIRNVALLDRSSQHTRRGIHVLVALGQPIPHADHFGTWQLRMAGGRRI
jgi:hypothetical protein